MADGIELSGHPHGSGLEVRTPGRFAMNLAIDVLEFLDGLPDVSVKNTGWKDGYGLEVAAWTPIHTKSLIAEIMTDGDQFNIRRRSGPLSEFEDLFDLVQKYLDASGP